MPRKLLVVDDSRLARMTVIKLLALARPDWTVVEASNAEEALTAVAAGRIDGAVLDYHMPGADGLTLAAELKALRRDIHIAIVTANDQAGIVAQAAVIPALFLPKPLRAASFEVYLANVEASKTA